MSAKRPDRLAPPDKEPLLSTGGLRAERSRTLTAAEPRLQHKLVADGITEFLFIVTTLRLKGGTGSPVRPIAIR